MPPTNIDDRASQLTRRKFLGSAALVGAASLARTNLTHGEATAAPPDIAPFELDETTVVALQDGMKSGQFTARSIAQKYLDRIAEIDKQGPAINP